MSSKKCIVLDLDNTLWGGVVGEEGFDGIKLSLVEPGASFIAFQQALADLYNRGVILAINSRNNFDEAMKVIQTHPNMILREKHFAAWRINWEDKVKNLIELAKEINIGLDAMVFLDDDPTNRAAVREMLPEVEVPEMPTDPAQYAKFLIALPYFTSAAITDEDKMRGNLYVTERLRQEAEKSFADPTEFLKSLGIELEVFVDDATSIARLAQLTDKTNQFNANKKPLSEDEVTAKICDPKYKVFYARVTDRFGDNGITNLAIAEKRGEEWHLSTYLMSCRVIGRGVEEAFLSAIAQAALSEQAKKISIAFTPTEKNKPAEEFIKKHFVDKIADINKIINPPVWITIKNGKV